MSEDEKVKVYKNPQRNTEVAYKPYVPQYQVHGIEPAEYNNGSVPGNVILSRPKPLPLDNPRGRRSPIQQPYATVTASPIGKGAVPNVGNNMEHTWSSVDGEIIDDLDNPSYDPHQPMIDNNDFVTPEALGEYQVGLLANDIQPAEPKAQVTFEVESIPNVKKLEASNTEDLLPIVADLTENSYLLIVAGVAVCSGPVEEILNKRLRLLQ
jgi:hypothetical protein